MVGDMDSLSRAIFVHIFPKNWKSMGRQQVSHLSHEESVQWLDWLVQGLAPDTKPFLTLVVVRKLLRIALQALGLDSLMLTLASLRCGGATQLLKLTQNVPLIQHLGRWKRP